MNPQTAHVASTSTLREFLSLTAFFACLCLWDLSKYWGVDARYTKLMYTLLCRSIVWSLYVII